MNSTNYIIVLNVGLAMLSYAFSIALQAVGKKQEASHMVLTGIFFLLVGILLLQQK